jgi:hypothetical protein
MVTEFVDDDLGYVTWLHEHPRGFVVNSHRRPTQWYLSLHRARCIKGDPPRTSEYRRICGETTEELVEWAVGRVGIEPTRCDQCHP